MPAEPRGDGQASDARLAAALIPARVARADALRDPTARRIVAALRGAETGLTTEELAARLDLDGSWTRRRIRRLVQAGVVTVSEGESSGPGRPPRRLTLAPVSVGRERAGHAALTRLVARLVRDGGFSAAAAREFGRRHGHDLLPEPPTRTHATRALAALGFAPVRISRAGRAHELALTRCPFAADRTAAPGEDVVCALHHGIVAGIGERLGLRLELRGPEPGDPASARCRVVVGHGAAPPPPPRARAQE